MLEVDMILEHLLSPLQEQKLRMEARSLRQENARLKLRLEKALERERKLEEGRRQLEKVVSSDQAVIKSLNKKIEQLELQKFWVNNYGSFEYILLFNMNIPASIFSTIV